MLQITYENEAGKVTFGGGGSESFWRIIEAEGLGITGKTLNTVSYPASIGQYTLSETPSARTITIQCDVRCFGPGKSAVSRALKVLNLPGELIIRSGGRIRKIGARCTDCAQGERYGGYRVFAVQFVCDYPYFEDVKNTIVPIFKRENLLCGGIRWYKNDDSISSEPFTAGKFKLPCLFSKRITEASVLNLGDTESEPVIRITVKDGSYTGADKGKLFIENKSTHRLIDLECGAEKGDIITLDIPNRKIYNQKGNNLVHYLAPDSFLSDFWLKTGKNIISVTNNITGACVVELEFSNKYIEAVIE